MQDDYKPYNTGPFAPSVAAEQLPEVDMVYSAMFAVHQLAWQLECARVSLVVTPLVYMGVFDRDVRETFEIAFAEWGSFGDAKHFLIAGQHEEARQRQFLEARLLQARMLKYLGEQGITVHSQVEADFTPPQAKWAAERFAELGLEAMALGAFSAHLPRAFLTQLRAFDRRGERVVLLPWLMPRDPFRKARLTEPWGRESFSMVGLHPGEAARIRAYSYGKIAAGQDHDVATLKELEAYCHWLFNESPVAGMLAS